LPQISINSIRKLFDLGYGIANLKSNSCLGNPAGLFTLPVAPLLQRPVKLDGPRTRAIIDAGAAIPAFLWMQDNRTPSLLGIRDENIDGAAVNTRIAAIAYLGVVNNRPARSRNIWKS